jgi:hypothetical protein
MSSSVQRMPCWSLPCSSALITTVIAPRQNDRIKPSSFIATLVQLYGDGERLAGGSPAAFETYSGSACFHRGRNVLGQGSCAGCAVLRRPWLTKRNNGARRIRFEGVRIQEGRSLRSSMGWIDVPVSVAVGKVGAARAPGEPPRRMDLQTLGVLSYGNRTSNLQPVRKWRDIAATAN